MNQDLELKNPLRKKWLHVIGACGKATAPIAAMFKRDLGWFVTGTDLQFLEPASNIITENEIPFEQSYHFSHLTKEFWVNKVNNIPDTNDVPDLVLAVETLTKDNKEYRFAALKNIDIRPFSEILRDYLIKNESFVVIGTAGKTTTTSMITYMLKNLNLNPSYMIGAEVADFEYPCVNTNSNFSVMEGDEYHSKAISKGAKFLQFKPKYLVITNVGYEHQDIFPTVQEYINEFKKGVDLVPTDGLIVANTENIPEEILKDSKAKVIRYGYKSKGANIYSFDYSFNENEKEYKVLITAPGGVAHEISTKKLKIFPSKHNFEDLVTAFILLKETQVLSIRLNELNLGTLSNAFEALMEGFIGPKKRLETLYKGENRIVIDDFGVAPNRAKNSIDALKEEFKDYKIIAVFEPNSGSRPKDLTILQEMYKNSFNKASEVIIPDLSEFNTELSTASDLVEALKSNNVNAVNIPASKINEYIESKSLSEKLLIVFFSSYRLDVESKKLAKSFSVQDN